MKKLTQAKKSVQRPQWAKLIRAKRLQLNESQAEFGKRFDVSHAAVSDWERGVSDVPGVVTWWLKQNEGVDNDTK